jgi:NTP pyrophosphatase (non-canonical NTP hydrolase)
MYIPIIPNLLLIIMDLSKIQEKQKQFILARKWERFPSSQIFSHLIEELGEIASHFLYDERYKVKGAGHHGNSSQIDQEFAQAFNLFLQLAIKEGVDLETAWIMENVRNETRFSKEKWLDLAEED